MTESSIAARDLRGAAVPRSAATDTAFEIVSDRTGFLALRNEWDALFERSGKSHQLFQTFDWLNLWCRHYVGTGGSFSAPSLRIVVGRARGRVVLIWPLAQVRMLGMSRIGWMGDPVGQYGDVLIEDGPRRMARLEASWDYLQDALPGDAVLLRKVRDDSAVVPLLRKLGVTVTGEEQAPFADLTDIRTFEAYQARFSKRLRRNRRRQRNRLADLGPLSFEFHDHGAAAQQAVAEAMRMKRRWLKQRGLISTAFADDRVDAFFADAVATAERGCSALVSVLKLADRPVAVEIGLLCKGRYVSHIGAFDLDHARLSPGTLQMEETLRHCIEDRGADCLDLLAPGSDYKDVWADGSVRVRDYVLAKSPLGRLYAGAYLQTIRPGLKDGLTRLPAFLTRLVPQA